MITYKITIVKLETKPDGYAINTPVYEQIIDDIDLQKVIRTINEDKYDPPVGA